MKILIVDDSALLRERLRESLLLINDLEIVGEATNGMEALQIIDDTNPDFIILDIRMPDMNGFAVLDKLKKQGNKSLICVFTNYRYQQYKQKCKEAGADYFFDKNQDFNEVIKLVTRLSFS